jgi:site-specific recombinase XerD
MNSRSPQKKVGDFRPIVSPVTGAVLSIEAYAGRVHGRKLRRRFKLSHYGSVKWAQAAAESWVQEVTEERVDNQRAFLSLTPGMREDCVEAIEMLRPYRLSIAEAVRTYVLPELKEKKGLADPWTFRQAANAVLEFKRFNKKSPHYLRGLKGYLSTICLSLGERFCDDIKVKDLEDFLAERERLPDKRRIDRKALRSTTIKNYRRYLSIVFSFAVDRGHATANPALKLGIPARENEPVHIFTVEEARRLLEAAESKFIPDLVLGLFAGLRPISEVLTLEARSFNFEKRWIEITAKRSKTRRRRFVQMSENLVLWLEPFKAFLHQRLSYQEYRGARDRTRAAAGLKWHQDILRHSFASYHLALHENAAKTSLELGHSSANLLFEAYRELVSKSSGKDYFSIIPANCKFTRPEVAAFYSESPAALPLDKVVMITPEQNIIGVV